MKTIQIINKTGSNYTPAGLMYKYAKEHRTEQFYYHGRSVIVLDGVEYGFDHWDIHDNGNGTETTTISLFPCGHLIRH